MEGANMEDGIVEHEVQNQRPTVLQVGEKLFQFMQALELYHSDQQDETFSSPFFWGVGNSTFDTNVYQLVRAWVV